MSDSNICDFCCFWLPGQHPRNSGVSLMLPSSIQYALDSQITTWGCLFASNLLKFLRRSGVWCCSNKNNASGDPPIIEYHTALNNRVTVAIVEWERNRSFDRTCEHKASPKEYWPSSRTVSLPSLSTTYRNGDSNKQTDNPRRFPWCCWRAFACYNLIKSCPGPLWLGNQWVKSDHCRVFPDPGMLHRMYSLPIEQENE